MELKKNIVEVWRVDFEGKVTKYAFKIPSKNDPQATLTKDGVLASDVGFAFTDPGSHYKSIHCSFFRDNTKSNYDTFMDVDIDGGVYFVPHISGSQYWVFSREKAYEVAERFISSMKKYDKGEGWQ